jgi:hypothetical protein
MQIICHSHRTGGVAARFAVLTDGMVIAQQLEQL